MKGAIWWRGVAILNTMVRAGLIEEVTQAKIWNGQDLARRISGGRALQAEGVAKAKLLRLRSPAYTRSKKGASVAGAE